jgi:hypothetical protein
LGSWSQWFQSIMAGRFGRAEKFHLGCQETTRGTGRGQEQDTWKDGPRSDLLPPARPHLLKFLAPRMLEPKMVPSPAGNLGFYT